MNSLSEADDVNPLNEFSGCHDGIINNFQQLQELVSIIQKTADSEVIQPRAKKLLYFFDDVVLIHHAEEEQELFTIVMECAEKGQQADTARTYIKQLVAEHRELEAMWKEIENDLRLLSKGKSANLNNKTAIKLAIKYLAHAEFEEQVFLPLSAKILSKNDLSALGLSLHMRHQRELPVNYI